MARLSLKVIPKATHAGVVGWIGNALKVRVTAPPERGKANAEVIDLIARVLGVDRGEVKLMAGAADSRKSVEVQGVTDGDLRTRIASHLREK